MITIVFTWIGAVLGIAVLLAMAVGAFVVDFDDALADRRKEIPAPEGSRTSAS
ncbi:hypothetical protein LWP59_00720 [Amycolatopsis acidiphila]|uniref:hypothetical protein n=1 Tax=Amycolatopsis acidiphila TaxID=715473 RepID=UPI001643D231|nr:hypothetical protein [Amycolatopsis acidiphila]UIJ60258.1 hypothetical protein LWP59_00720 [Amycolatopsis acidiphila]GHG60459.1 hypothetical protein GCM10017788_14210 [Amycolatopsis acidiphila]